MMIHPSRRCCLAVLVLLALAGRVPAQSLLLTPNDSGVPGQADPLGGWGTSITTPGLVFTVSSSVDITALAYYFIPTNPLSASYTVTLYHWDGFILDQTLASTSVGGGSSIVTPSLNHNFAYNNITPVTLTPGNTYVLSTSGPVSGDFFYSTSGFSVAGGFNFVEGLNGSTTPGSPNSTAYLGPNAVYAAVPEPAVAGSLTGLLALVLVLGAQRHRRPSAV